MAEANRPDGFRVLSLGYAAGPGLSTETLTGASSQGYDSLVEDIHVAQELTGFRHYLTDPQVRLVNDFVLRHGVLDDHAPPVWTSTFNDHDGVPAGRADAAGRDPEGAGGNGADHRLVGRRAGHEPRHLRAVRATAAVRLRQGSVAERRHPARADAGAAGRLCAGRGRRPIPYQATVSGFASGVQQYLVIRAVDQSPAANQDDNTTVVTATP